MKGISQVLVLFALFTYGAADTLSQTCENGVCTNSPTPAFTPSFAKVTKDANELGRPPAASLEVCKDRHAQCIQYESSGECTKNPGWMIVNCPASCKACNLLDPKVRCNRARLNITEAPFFAPGEMREMFEHIAPRFGSKYRVTVISTDPWVVTLENFVSDKEIEAILSTVNDGWERSTDTGSFNEYGENGRVLSQSRTSSNAWCRQQCEAHPDVQAVYERIHEVTGVPHDNYESFQILRYELGQKYNPHHDASEAQVRLASGSRMLTFFLYLSDVEQGGETAFPRLNIAVKPRKGMALLWPSTQIDTPLAIDQRTLHEARPVIQGVKYAANAWIHTHDFRKANLWGCTGTFDQL